MFFVNIKSKSRPEFSDNPKKQHCQTTSTNRNKNVSIVFLYNACSTIYSTVPPRTKIPCPLAK